jgi:hypothetical protein
MTYSEPATETASVEVASAHVASAARASSWLPSPDVLSLATLVAIWLGTRALMLWLYVDRFQYIAGDVAYYFNFMSESDVGMLREYPLPVVWFLRLVYLIAGGEFTAFKMVFALAMTAFDVAAIVVLARRSKLAAGYWVLFTAAIGPILWVRFDIMVAFAICLALTWLGTSDHASGTAIAVAAGLKLWPAVLIAPLISPRRPGLRRLVGFAVTGLALAAASLLDGGWLRSISPLKWQSDRGLQIESIPATWPMAMHGFPDSGYTVSYAKSNCLEVFGQSVPFWLHVSSAAFDIALVLIVALSGWLWWQQHRLPAGPESEATAHRIKVAQVGVVLTAILLLIITNKTLSPQYMFWLAGPLAVGLYLPQSIRGRLVAYAGASAALLAALLTQAVYPIKYTALIQPYQGDALATAILVVRNLLLLAMTIGAVAAAIQAVRNIPAK